MRGRRYITEGNVRASSHVRDQERAPVAALAVARVHQ
jgi:hypothetical protein